MSPESTCAAPIRILVVDDHPLLREGVAAVVGRQADMAMAGEACCGEEAIEKTRALRPDVILMDLQMPGIGGLAALARIRGDFPDARVVVLATQGSEVEAMQASRSGAAGYLLKSALRKELVDTLRAVHAGRRVVAPELELAANPAAGLAEPAAEGALTWREIDVLQRVAQGCTNKQVARALSVSEAAVKARMKSLLGKLDARDRAHAVAIGLRRGFVQPLAFPGIVRKD